MEIKMASIAYILFLCLTLAASTNDQKGGKDIGAPKKESGCGDAYTSEKGSQKPLVLNHCSPIPVSGLEVTTLVKQHITTSYHYLFLSSYFGNYVKNRMGFQKLFRKLSDRMWEDALDIIKYASKRGLEVEINNIHLRITDQEKIFGKEELSSLTVALDLHKGLTQHLHGLCKAHVNNDVDLKNYLEDNFMEKHTHSIRDLSGHIHDLKKFYKEPVSVFLFDEYLQSVY